MVAGVPMASMRAASWLVKLEVRIERHSPREEQWSPKQFLLEVARVEVTHFDLGS